MLRALASDGLLEALPGRRFALTPMTRALVSDAPNSMRNMVLNIACEDFTQVWARLDHSIRTGEPAWSLFHKGDLWAYLADRGDLARVFHGAMAELTRESATAYAQAFEFGRSGSVVDLGGGQGQLLAAILRAHPGRLELPFNVQVGGAGRRQRGRGAGGRCQSCSDGVPPP